MNQTTPTTSTSFRVGDIVLFGRTHGEKTRGRVLRISAKSLQIETIEERGSGRGSAAGRKWRVHPSLVTPVTGTTTPPAKVVDHRGRVDLLKSVFIANALTFGLDAPATVEAFNSLKLAVNNC